MILFRKSIALIGCLLAFGSGFAYGSDKETPPRKIRAISLPPDAVLNESSAIVLDSAAGVGFIASVTSGALISFSVTSGKVLSSVQLGEVAGAPSMIQIGERRLIALPTANDPDGGRPATIHIINATRAEQLEHVAQIALPPDARLTPGSRAWLTRDGRFGVIASSFQSPALFSFGVDTGQVITRLPLPASPSGIALHENGGNRAVAVASPTAGYLLISKLDQQGLLSPTGTVTLADTRFDDANEPVFSADGRKVYIAAARGDQFIVINAETATPEQSVAVSCPQRITVAQGADGAEIIAVTRLRHPANNTPGGVTILTADQGQLQVKADFTPLDGSPLSRANNVVFNADASRAFVGSVTGILFSFDPMTGKLVTYTAVGGELRGLAASAGARSLLVARATLAQDDIAVINIDRLSEDKLEALQLPRIAPEIKSVSNQGTYVHLLIEGTNFRKGSIVEFIKAGQVVLKQSPARVTESQLTVAVPAKTISELGKFEIRVVTGTNIATDPVIMGPLSVPSGENTSSLQARSVRKEPVKEPALQKGPTKEPAIQREPVKEAFTQREPVREAAAQGEPVADSSLPAASVLHAVRPMVEDNLVRVFIDTDGAAEVQAFTLANPARIVVDISGVRNTFGHRTMRAGGCITRVRTGQPKPGVARIVLDTKGKVGYRVTREGSSVVIDACDANLDPAEGIAATQR
ncbi:MAG TPA: AMIN domain-containing protein [Blastocatellia bacterium]|nr:AMIN domain-containing protein [Blastocatellia bacterium]